MQGSGADASAGYHGYWITDFTQIDPHLGTNAEMKTLIDEAHAKGMKVFFDIITNHTADVIDYEPATYTYIDKATAPYKDADGKVFDDKDVRRQGHLPGPRPGDVVPAQARLPDRGRQDRQGAGLAQRPDALPQPRRLDLLR